MVARLATLAKNEHISTYKTFKELNFGIGTNRNPFGELIPNHTEVYDVGQDDIEPNTHCIDIMQ